MTAVDAGSRPGLRRGVRLTHDPVRGQHALLYPEGVLLLNETAGAVVSHCGGDTVTAIAAELRRTYDNVAVDDVLELVRDLVDRRILTVDPTESMLKASRTSLERHEGRLDHEVVPGPPRQPVPTGLLAELTYRCPLRCTYCSNPVQLSAYRDELPTAAWLRVLTEARDLGVLQVHLSGGEPLLRPDLTDLVAHARRLGLYTNLVTSGVPLTGSRLAALAEAGLDHVQLSIQDADPGAADAVAGIAAHDRKRTAAALVRRHGIPLTVNAVLHRGNIGRLPEIAAFGVRLGADRLELAHTQFYGWGWQNRAALLPTREQVARAQLDAAAVRDRYGDDVEIIYVAADYYGGRPKPCMSGWGARQLVVAPNGAVLPCPAAGQIRDLGVHSVRFDSLADIWYAGAAFNRFRGTRWMPEPCRSCALREVDFGGCRCQAYQLTGDAAQTDPACALSPHHHLLTGLVAAAQITDAEADTGAAADPPVAAPRRWR
ncbi:pyrroloquinoline quinone biosynthesis protein PqqE [Actinomycetes bacterium KLBMP 9797]